MKVKLSGSKEADIYKVSTLMGQAFVYLCRDNKPVLLSQNKANERWFDSMNIGVFEEECLSKSVDRHLAKEINRFELHGSSHCHRLTRRVEFPLIGHKPSA